MTERKALIIEDDPMLGNIASKVLQQLGFKTLLDSEGNHYQHWLDVEGAPDVVLLDIHLPYALGTDILRHIHTTPGLEKLPVIMMSADILRIKELQAQGEKVLLKPVSVTRLQHVIKELFPDIADEVL